MKQWMQFCVILAFDLSICSATPTHCDCPREGDGDIDGLQGKAWNEGYCAGEVTVTRDGEGGVCATRAGHREATSCSGAEDGKAMAWRQMKWIGEAASCRVKGHLIEKLDDLNDFRRGYTLKFSPSVMDKTHLLPWLLASRAPELGLRRRRVYLDLGASSFASSVEWFLRMYPCDFTEVYAFEMNPDLWDPPHFFDEDANVLPAHVRGSYPIRVKSTPGIPQWMMERVKINYLRVSHMDDPSTNSINITRFIKEELRLTPADTVVVKMDIEGAEWPILTQWIKDPLMPLIVDELFVEVHYATPTMIAFDWNSFAPFTRDDALTLLADLRWHGFYAHFWT